MATETTPDGVAVESDLEKQLKACQPDRQDLDNRFSSLLQNLWTEAIRVVEELLKHSDLATPEGDRLLKAYRSRLLNEGNRLKRMVPMVLEDYLVKKHQVRELTTRKLPLNDGDIWGLPKGVKMPVGR